MRLGLNCEMFWARLTCFTVPWNMLHSLLSLVSVIELCLEKNM